MNELRHVFSWETMTHKGCRNLQMSCSVCIFVFMSQHKCEEIKMLVIPLITLIWSLFLTFEGQRSSSTLEANSFSLRSMRWGVEVEENGTEDSISSLLVLQKQFARGLSHLKIKQVLYLLTLNTYFRINWVKSNAQCFLSCERFVFCLRIRSGPF